MKNKELYYIKWEKENIVMVPVIYRKTRLPILFNDHIIKRVDLGEDVLHFYQFARLSDKDIKTREKVILRNFFKNR